MYRIENAALPNETEIGIEDTSVGDMDVKVSKDQVKNGRARLSKDVPEVLECAAEL